MKLRKSTDTSADAEVVEADDSAFANGGKGRPTPKRRDVVGSRGPVTAPKTRKEAYARQKQLSKRARTARASTGRSLTPAERRAALRSGELLPARDQGPTRKLARDYVDSHRMFSNYLLWLFPLMVATYVIPQAAIIQLVIIAMFFGLLVEWYIVGGRLRRMAIERFGSAQGSSMSIGFYAGSRAYLPRRWRLPAPQVERGDEI
ncbi:MAG TPA: DUF3043 domain-containing protein [Jatrophihabitantaceae bacterium]|nr:DUF3043 domain-containing protein [Jatrophihabitantaceae bacterium]